MLASGFRSFSVSVPVVMISVVSSAYTGEKRWLKGCSDHWGNLIDMAPRGKMQFKVNNNSGRQ